MQSPIVSGFIPELWELILDMLGVLVKLINHRCVCLNVIMYPPPKLGHFRLSINNKDFEGGSYFRNLLGRNFEKPYHHYCFYVYLSIGGGFGGGQYLRVSAVGGSM